MAVKGYRFSVSRRADASEVIQLAAVFAEVPVILFQQRILPVAGFHEFALERLQPGEVSPDHGFHLAIVDGNDPVHGGSDIIDKGLLVEADLGLRSGVHGGQFWTFRGDMSTAKIAGRPSGARIVC